VPLYKSARAGRTVARSSRPCVIHGIEIVSFLRASTVDVVFDVVCSKGTYVRTLCADIGETLGVGGHLASLERRRVGRFGIEQALSLEEFADVVARNDVHGHLLSLGEALSELPAFMLDPVCSESVRHGTGFSGAGILSTEGQWSAGSPVRVYGADGRLIAIGTTPWGSEDPKGADSAAVVKIAKVLI